MKSFFVSGEVCRLCDVSYRQIRYWDEASFIKPSYRRKGKYRLYTLSDLLYLKWASYLRKEKYSLPKLRVLLKQLRALIVQLATPLRELSILVKGENLLVTAREVSGSPGALEDYSVFQVADLIQKVEAAFPEDSQSEGVN